MGETETVTVDGRFNGPIGLGHGGYSCAVAAVRVDAPVAAVSMRRPMPLDTPLAVRRGDEGSVSLLDGDEIVIEAARAELDLEPPGPVSLETAEATTPNVAPDEHPFPTCFGCGPRRDPAESIRVMLGAVAGRDGVFADSWTPLAEFADDEGNVTPLFMWAALDCPTGWAGVPQGEVPHVLARLVANPGIAPVRTGEPHVVVGWAISHEGRKRRAGAAIYSAEGDLCAISEGLWIAVRDPAAHGARV
jgi:hypothetical protein